MATPLEELSLRIAEIRADLRFIDLASRLRPRLGAILNWEGQRETIALAREFIGHKESRPESIFSALLVRTFAAFERYLRQLIEFSVNHMSASAALFEEIPDTIRTRNLLLTGRLIAAHESPRDYQSVDYAEIVANLASCTPGSESFKLNAVAFSTAITGGSPEMVERALRSINVEDWWDAVCGDRAIQRLLNGRAARDTAGLAEAKLKELSRWRNQVAHAGDEEIAMSPDNLAAALDFIEAFSSGIDREVARRLRIGRSRAR